MPSATRSKARRALSHAGRNALGGSKIPAGRWFWSLSTRCPGRRGAGRGNQHRSAHPADALPSAEAALLGRVYPHRTGSPTPRPSTPDTPRPLPPTGSPGQNPAAAPQGLLPLCRAGVGAVLGCDDVVDPAVQDCDDEPVPDGEVTVELCCADPRVEENHIQGGVGGPSGEHRIGRGLHDPGRLAARGGVCVIVAAGRLQSAFVNPTSEDSADLRITTRTTVSTARSTLTNPPTCPTATTNPAPSTVKASNARRRTPPRSSGGLPGSLDGDFADGAGVGARAPS